MFSLTNCGEVGQMTEQDNGGTAVPLRPKNQITLPTEIARAMKVAPGDRLLFSIDPANPETAVIRRLRESYFGVLAGAYGSNHDDQLNYVRAEQEGWGESSGR
jgi:bifunctional DNA-binding transcriptional regulator/antitoxin component of YhaV-PrlF toxin-antitoxin module